MEKLVHFDLKGGAPLVSYYHQIIPLLSKWGATGIILEYEDMFPYSGDLAILRKSSAYSHTQIKEIVSLANNHGLKVIPLVQTIGHLEFVLKHKKFMHLREEELYPNSLCPQHSNSFSFVMSMINQVLELHENSSILHIGADEVWHLGKCRTCQEKMKISNWSPIDLYLQWIVSLSKNVKLHHPNLQLIIWDDMLRTVPLHKLKQSELGCFVEPMLWKYEASNFNFPSDMFDRICGVFDRIWVASSFKGATGSTQFLPPIQHHVNNHLTWLSTIEKHKDKFKQVRGIALTGWQRYDHYAVLCELLPVALPSLALCLATLNNEAFTESVHDSVSKELGFSSRINVNPFPRPQILEEGMTYPGHELLTAVQMWSNLVCKYQTICNSEGMLGWFSDYFRSKNFTNPAQVESILFSLIELQDQMKDLEVKFVRILGDYFYSDTVEEWIGCFLKPLLQRIESIIKDCKDQLHATKESLGIKEAQFSPVNDDVLMKEF